MHHNNDIISGKISSDIENMEWSMGTTTAQLPNVRYVLYTMQKLRFKSSLIILNVIQNKSFHIFVWMVHGQNWSISISIGVGSQSFEQKKVLQTGNVCKLTVCRSNFTLNWYLHTCLVQHILMDKWYNWIWHISTNTKHIRIDNRFL